MSRRAFWALTVSASLVHAALTVPFAGRKDLWKDDAYSMVVATKSLSKIVGYLWHREAAMAPFYMLLHFWARVSRDPGVLRLLPIAFAVAVPPLVAIAVKPRMGERRASPPHC